MSARELIDQLAALPAQEQTLFEQLFQEMKSDSASPAPVGRADRPDFGDRLRRIYGEKTTSDSQQIIDEGRGER